MSDSTRTDLHPSLRAFPGMVFEIAPDGSIASFNARVDSVLDPEIRGRPLDSVFDPQSAVALQAMLQSNDWSDDAPVLDLTLRAGEIPVNRRFYLAADEFDSGRHVWLVELPAVDPPAPQPDQPVGNRVSELAAQKELARQSARLTRMVEEIERKLEENERLSAMLQYQNEETERQNQELLTLTEELHAGQEDLLQANQQLEMRTRQLQVALSARNRFYAAMSHELRTPINAVMGYNDLLLAGIYGPLSERQELAIERSQRAVRHLRALVNDVLDLSTIELGRMELVWERVDIRQLVESLFVAMRPLAESQGSTLHLNMGDSAPEVVTDARCVRQILLNIITYSVRMAGGSPVWVQCSQDAAGVTIEVTDNGGGMSTEEASELFEEFAMSATSPAGSPTAGTGLGLPVARRLATLLGGRVEASTTPGVGNVFRITLPITHDHPLQGAGQEQTRNVDA